MTSEAAFIAYLERRLSEGGPNKKLIAGQVLAAFLEHVANGNWFENEAEQLVLLWDRAVCEENGVIRNNDSRAAIEAAVFTQSN